MFFENNFDAVALIYIQLTWIFSFFSLFLKFCCHSTMDNLIFYG